MISFFLSSQLFVLTSIKKYAKIAFKKFDKKEKYTSFTKSRFYVWRKYKLTLLYLWI